MLPALLFPLLGSASTLLEPFQALVLRSALFLGARLSGLSPAASLFLVGPPVALLMVWPPAPVLALLSSGSVVSLVTGTPLRPSASLRLVPVLAVLVAVLSPVVVLPTMVTLLAVLSTVTVLVTMLTTLPVVAAMLPALLVLAAMLTALLVATTLLMVTAAMGLLAAIASHPGHGVLDRVDYPVVLPPALTAAVAVLLALLLAVLRSVVLLAPAATDARASPPSADLLAVELVLGAALVPAAVLSARGPVATGLVLSLPLPAAPVLMALPVSVALLVSLSVLVTSVVLIHWWDEKGTSNAADAPSSLSPAAP